MGGPDDPPAPIFDSIRQHLELMDPSSFVEGALKQQLQGERQVALGAWKKEVGVYSATHARDSSDFREPAESGILKYGLTCPNSENVGFLDSFAGLYCRVAVGIGLLVATAEFLLRNTSGHLVAFTLLASLIPLFLFAQKRISTVC